MARTVAIGEQDFREIVQNNYFYTDKTCFIKEWWENADAVTLITRPRRFGKTLTMSMLYYFFSVDQSENRFLFENLRIWNESRYHDLQGAYPVIFLSFADVKCNSYEDTYYSICRIIAREYRKHFFKLNADCFIPSDRNQFYRILNGNANVSDICSSINQLCEYLYQYYRKKTIILLDEYDTPMQEAYINGYWNELTAFIKRLFHSTFKTNPYLERGLMTGITRVSKESVFSDLNNLEVVTTTSEKYRSCFGFTLEEVTESLHEFQLQDKSAGVKRWYDGFRFGSCDNIFNPWSITQFLDKGKFAEYWANTSSNKLVGELIQKGSPDLKIIMEDLLNGHTFHTTMDEQTIFDQLDQSDEAVWSFLVAGGYLKIVKCQETSGEFGLTCLQYELAVTNLETMSVFRKMIYGWFSNKCYGYHNFIKALLINDLENMNTFMNQLTVAVISNFDSGSKLSGKTEPERFYHGFVLGMMLALDQRYIITSNRESGFGRYDVLLEPLNREDDGIIFEFKVCDPRKEKDLASTAKTAIRQILDQRYAAKLEANGISKDKIRIYGFAFAGKNVRIDGGYMCSIVLPEKE